MEKAASNSGPCCTWAYAEQKQKDMMKTSRRERPFFNFDPPFP